MLLGAMVPARADVDGGTDEAGHIVHEPAARWLFGRRCGSSGRWLAAAVLDAPDPVLGAGAGDVRCHRVRLLLPVSGEGEQGGVALHDLQGGEGGVVDVGCAGEDGVAVGGW